MKPPIDLAKVEFFHDCSKTCFVGPYCFNVGNWLTSKIAYPEQNRRCHMFLFCCFVLFFGPGSPGKSPGGYPKKPMIPILRSYQPERRQKKDTSPAACPEAPVLGATRAATRKTKLGPQARRIRGLARARRQKREKD